MNYIRLVSDIHLDFDVARFHKTRIVDSELEAKVALERDLAFLWFPDVTPDDSFTTLVVAGDLWTDTRFLLRKYSDGLSWMAKLAQRFQNIVFVLGNHDYWGENFTYVKSKINDELKAQELTNVFLLEDDSVVLGNVKFVGSTLWTDYDRQSPLVMMQAAGIMNDYKQIKSGPRYSRLRPDEVLVRHQQSVNYIFEHAKRDHSDQIVCVVSHMAPSVKSIHETFMQSQQSLMMNHYYFSSLEQRIFYEGSDIDLWFHGHTHHMVDYVLDNQQRGCRVVCNPRGYSGQERTDWQPKFRVRTTP